MTPPTGLAVCRIYNNVKNLSCKCADGGVIHNTPTGLVVCRIYNNVKKPELQVR